MKIRIKGNSLRYRLSKLEVELFTETEKIAELTEFGNQSLQYVLQRYDGDELSAQFNNNTITLFMPATMANEWANTNRVGFDNGTAPLFLLVEKDFQCLDNVTEDQSDNYPNPLLRC
ncbi:DUF7009 family protein [Mucilaginibacter paludis]|uniref:Uncharacterized protein n=1 Tax=Mucilaginibacter paludis DSM 18603 TaxID=714943 RepID=H1Y7U7_9SPHI|nr:hypothetical protein [Mucilaginibacter paludis]EHQ30433.1 hypothetical protein Mucpa_6380 [Mucilaginibacter paludis DSM 18603]